MTTSEPQKIVGALVAAGWTQDGTKPGYVRLRHRYDPQPILVPTDRESAEYSEMLDEVALHLTQKTALGEAARHVLNTMHREGVAP